VLRRTGGAIYPKTALVENVEFFLVAALVILGVRTYFVQPFKIPTNSMWPTYNGMTPRVYEERSEEPGPLGVAARLVAFGAWPHRLDAPADGEILVPVGGIEARGVVHCKVVPGRSWLVLPAQVREYTLLVGGRPVTVKVPLDFDFDWAVYDAFFGSKAAYSRENLTAEINRRLQAGQFEEHVVNGQRLPCIRTGKRVRAGERVLAFDELTGDQLFVDRLSYHFVRPEVGSGFVFRTANIPEIGGDQYYIKRLVGTPGDQLEIRGTALYRNGAPITGSSAFDANARRSDQYTGYVPFGLLDRGRTITVPPDRYFALGDNSANSQDGRYWGYVPARDVVGRPIFVYYPFSKHWGPAR
jgi:signal peptidase I